MANNTRAPFFAHSVLASAAADARKSVRGYQRIVAKTAFRGRVSYEHQIREGDILVDSGETVVAVYDSVWDQEARESLSLPYSEDDGSGVIVAIEGGSVHGLTWLSGDVEVFRPVQ